MSSKWPDDDDDDLNVALNDAALQQLLDQPESALAPHLKNQLEGGLRTNRQHEGFDDSTGDTWIYPINLPMRSYQYNIAHAALYRNTLVVLPTGLGKTFIAAVVMYNLYRWYPRGKIIFMAPTRPLVSQQISACQKIMPFPVSDTVELTGKLPRTKRFELWASKRVFFVTPQVVQSDMLDEGGGGSMAFPFTSIKLLVVDEAHRAKGRYAYTQVTESLFARNPYFRMLALSATPGRTMDDVVTVCRNLYISHLEVRSDSSIDVQQYVHQRNLRTVVVSLGDDIKNPRARLLKIIDPYLRELVNAEVLNGALGNINRNYLLFEQKRFQERAASGQRHPEHSIISSNFSICISLYHALELLERHGLRVFVNSFDVDEEGRSKFVLQRDAQLRALVEELRERLGANPFNVSVHPMTNGQVAPMPAQLDYGHPKYEYARQALLDHFQAHPDSRAIVFCEYRESVMLIQRLLLQQKPLLRPRCFVGQGGTTGSIRALTQKQQLEIMKDFRSGTSNVLVATSIGEEGIDVGEVELIVCFDICTSNPTRFVQRIGRTGRQKRGQVVMLATEGREQQLLKEVLASRDQTNRKLLQSPLVKRALYEHAPRLVPTEYNPKCVQKFIEPQTVAPEEATKVTTRKKREGTAAKATTKATRGKVKSHDLRNFFRSTEPPMLDTQERLDFEQEGNALPQPDAQTDAWQPMVKIPTLRFSVEFLADTQPTSTTPASPPASTNSQQETQRIRKLNRLLRSNKSMLAESQRTQDLVAQLQDKQLPNSIKLYLLQSNISFVEQISAKMQQLVTMEKLNSRQQRTARTYDLMVEISDGQLWRLLRPPEARAELRLENLEDPLVKQQQTDLEAACEQIFAGLDEQGLCVDNYDLIQGELEKLELRQLEQTMKEQLLESKIYDGGTLTDEDECVESVLQETIMQELDHSQCEFQPAAVRHNSTPLRARPRCESACSSRLECLAEQPEHMANDGEQRSKDNSNSIIESSDLFTNLSRLNNLMSASALPDTAASTPIASKPLQPKPLQLALEENLSLFDQLTEPSCAEPAASATNIDLAIDLNDFLEPLPEEQQLLEQQLLEQQTQKQLLSSPSAKENQSLYLNCRTSPAALLRHNSPDIFAEESRSPTPERMQIKSLASKLASMARPTKPPMPAVRTPDKCAKQVACKSPSIMDIYMQRLNKAGCSTTALAKPADESLLVRCQRKRKIIVSDSSEEDSNQQVITLDDDSSDFEQVPYSQQQVLTPPRINITRPRQKRRKFNSFIIDEADQSGSDHDEEAEQTIGCYIKDSVIVSSDDEEGAHNNTTTHAMYLQAARSPMQRHGAFKIPDGRIYQDESYIYSQPVIGEPSQYLPCSFIVDEGNLTQETRDVSECPLERAERILKQQRREKRRAKQSRQPQQAKRRRILLISSSSGEE